ncbi:MAG: histidine kinase [Bacteroidota bacterium]
MQFKSFLLLLLLGLLSPVDGQDFRIVEQEIEIASADREDWQRRIPTQMGQYRLRMSVRVEGEKPPEEHYSLYVSLMASSEVYWDGQLIGRNGKVGKDKAAEEPGALYAAFLIPDALLTPGVHQVELLISNFHARGKIRLYGMWVNDYLDPTISVITTAAYMHIYAGCFLIIGLFYLARYLANMRDFPLLAFALLCLAFFALIIIEYIKVYYFYPYSWHFPRLQIILGLTFVIGLCLPLFFALRFAFQGLAKYFLPLLAFFAWMIDYTRYGYDYSTNFSMIAGFLLSTLFCLIACWRRFSGSWLALLGVLPITLALVIGYEHYDTILYVGFAHLVLMILISLAIKEKEDRRVREEALLLSSRLELELLKKNIQPHFLMNSITSAIDWIERFPQQGVKLLLALSQEFEILLDISGEKIISIHRELDLCRTHLEIMGFRKEQEYRLGVDGVGEEDEIPPAIFLTIIENGISHQNAGEEPVRFQLTKEEKEQQVQYRLLAEGRAEREPKGTVRYGTGLRYIEARLEESYPGRWALHSQSVAAGWLTEITIQKRT